MVPSRYTVKALVTGAVQSTSCRWEAHDLVETTGCWGTKVRKLPVGREQGVVSAVGASRDSVAFSVRVDGAPRTLFVTATLLEDPRASATVKMVMERAEPGDLADSKRSVTLVVDAAKPDPYARIRAKQSKVEEVRVLTSERDDKGRVLTRSLKPVVRLLHQDGTVRTPWGRAGEEGHVDGAYGQARFRRPTGVAVRVGLLRVVAGRALEALFRSALRSTVLPFRADLTAPAGPSAAISPEPTVRPEPDPGRELIINLCHPFPASPGVRAHPAGKASGARPASLKHPPQGVPMTAHPLLRGGPHHHRPGTDQPRGRRQEDPRPGAGLRPGRFHRQGIPQRDHPVQENPPGPAERHREAPPG